MNNFEALVQIALELRALREAVEGVSEALNEKKKETAAPLWTETPDCQVIYFRESHVCEEGKEGRYGYTTDDGETIYCAFCRKLVEVEEDPVLSFSTLKKGT